MKNLDAQYLGAEQINSQHSAQLEKFRQWAAVEDWSEFHTNHYDWWMFPISQPSQMGFRYVVFEEDVTELLNITGFKDRHAEGAQLLLLSWGWDFVTGSKLQNPAKDQAWQNWPIRLFKCAESMRLFGQNEMFEACLKFATFLKSDEVSFNYNGRDLSAELGI